MLINNKEKIQRILEQLPDNYVNEVLEYLLFLEFRSKNKITDKNSMLLPEETLAKDWLTPEEDEAWKNL